MIKNKKELKYYIKCDLKQAGRKSHFMYIGSEIERYLFYLRKNEYFTHKSLLNGIYKINSFYYRYKQHKLGIKLGFDIPINVVKQGLRIDHWGFLAISGNARIGKNCHIYGDVTIGVKNNKDQRGPIIGDNVTIGAGARIIGPVKIASGSIIGANCVVTKDIIKENSVCVGIPAKVIN